MTPNQRALKILKESEYFYAKRYPVEYEPAIKQFLESAEGCPWLDPSDPVEERQFETSLKGWFPFFYDELIKYAKSTKPIIYGKNAPFIKIGLHTMDDQGFEGQILGDGSYHRWIEDEEGYN